MKIRPDCLEAVAVDRTKIVRNFIKEGGHLSMGAITAFAGHVFFEPGWNFDVVEVLSSNERYEFFVRSYDVEAR